MTRKRCVNLHMAKGYDRNTANAIAAEAVIAYGSYAKGYEQTLKIKSAIEGIDFFALGNLIGEFCATVVDAVAALTRTFKEANNQEIAKLVDEIKSRP